MYGTLFAHAFVLLNMPFSASGNPFCSVTHLINSYKNERGFLGWSPGEGNDSLLQYSCLENPMDKGALWAIAGVESSPT